MASKDKDKDTKANKATPDKPSAAQEEKEAKARRELGILGPHGDMRLASVVIEGYSLELRDGDGFVGDVASRTAFRHMLDAWRKLFTDMDGKDPMGRKSTRELSKHQLDAMLEKDGIAAQAIVAASEDYALQLAHVVQRFLKHKTWKGVERIIVGGGFHQSEVGGRSIARAGKILKAEKVPVELRTLHHHADEGGLIGWVHLAPPALLQSYDAILAVDIGGTNVRCGIVQTHLHRAPDMSQAEVVRREKWAHADDEPKRDELVEGIATILEDLIAYAEKKEIRLAPYIGVACPGLIVEDGSLAGGTQNLPGNWESTRFHLPRDLCERLPHIGDGRTQVCLHNDAVVQGLSEMPFTNDVERWAILTVGTGLGNASFTNRRDAPGDK
ncbi:ROK family protein [Acidovorax sp. A1169]|uniref:ROK family protein n=1 Tax=Acidovorax sp. A1169 TaxID=3059524 RepID=UPI002737B335|nr:ROK family protein [Acidovorax sp. A1169]MDP4074722.1 ROK family protein [Acidovorax sp. A1169]